MAEVLTCPEGYNGPYADPENEYHFYCFDPLNFQTAGPVVVTLDPEVSYAGLFCGGSVSYDPQDGGTMVYCDEPWLPQPGAVAGGAGFWDAITVADAVELWGAALLFLGVAWAGRLLLTSLNSRWAP